MALVACGGGGGGGGEGTAGGGGGGEIAIEGSSTVQPISQAAAEAFSEQNPDARISVGGSGTSDGFEAFCTGSTQISDASRPIDAEEEIPVCEENGVEFLELIIAYDGISVVVNTENGFAEDITAEQLRTLWEPAAEGEITQWSQVNPEWPDQEIGLYGPGTESGTYEFFNEIIIQNEDDTSRTDYEASEDDNVLVQGVSGDPNGIGYFWYAFYENNTDVLNDVSIDGIAPSEDSIRSGEYLLSRPLFIYVNSQELDENATLQEFVDFYVSPDNLDRLVEAARYVTLPPDVEQETLDAYENRTTGARYEAGESGGEGSMMEDSMMDDSMMMEDTN